MPSRGKMTGAPRARRPRATYGGGSPEYVYDDNQDGQPEVDRRPKAPGGKTFRDFGIAEDDLRRPRGRGHHHCLPDPGADLPVALDGHDLIGQARTGTGKTFAFGIPILERSRPRPPARPARPGP